MISKRTFLSSTIALGLATSLLAAPAFAQGGNNPVPGIDVIIKEAGIKAPVSSGRFGTAQLKKLNSMKGMDRPKYMAAVGAQMMEKVSEGAQPKGGWQSVFQKTLMKNWKVEERGGSTTVKAETQDPRKTYAVTFTVRTK